jgi:hypothetical protein
VIIVRTEAARAELYDAMPELRLVKAQVLTIADSKGCGVLFSALSCA